MPFPNAIDSVRDAVCAVLKVHPIQNNQFQVAIVGAAWGIVENRYLVTANHIFNNGQGRDPNDKFFVFCVPQNGDSAFHVPVVSFPLEDQTNNMAIIEIDASNNNNFIVQSVPITFRPHQDGEKVLTFGFPAPQIVQAMLTPMEIGWEETYF